MGLLNTHQIHAGARNLAGDKTYAQCFVKTRPTAAASGDTITFTGGELEVEGMTFSMNGKAIDFGNIGTTLLASGQSFILSAVPKYNEPASRSAAETAGLDYYVESNSAGEGIMKLFMPSAVEAAVATKGGIDNLTKKINLGAGDASDMTVYNMYWEAQNRAIDPRYVPQPLKPIDFEFILAEVFPQDNSTKKNALLFKTKAEYDYLRAQLGEIYVERLIYTTGAADARYAGKYHLVKSAKTYTSAANAGADNGGTVVDLGVGFTNFAALTTATPAQTHVAVYEYTYPSNMALGQTGDKLGISRFITRENTALLGRINPIYLDNPIPQARFPITNPASRMTHYADPCALLRVNLGASLAATIVSSLYDSYI